MPLPSTPQDWIIHQCQACGSPMKVRSQTVTSGARVSCPVCQTPVLLQAAGSQAPEFRGEMPSQDRPAGEAPRRDEVFGRRDAQFSGGAQQAPGPLPSRLPGEARREESGGFEQNAAAEEEAAPPVEDGFLRHLKHTEDYESHRKLRVKRKRKAGMIRPEEMSDWNTAQADIPEAKVEVDPWANPQRLPEEVVQESEAQFVVSEVRDEGGVMRRVKRVKKRRMLTLGREFFRRLTFSMRILILAMVAGLAGWAAWSGWEVIRTKWVALFYKEEAERARPPQIFLTSQDESGATEVLAKFLTATSIEEKLKWVRLPERVGPLMTDWYKKHPDVALTPGEVLDRTKILAGTAGDKLYLVKLDLEVEEPNPLEPGKMRKSRRWYFVEEAGAAEHRSYKVDWEMAVKYQPMTWEEFRTERPTRPVAFRVMLRGGDYHNHGFTDEEKWAAVHLYYPDPDDGENFLFHGYLEQGTQGWRDLNLFTVPGNAAAYILRLRYPQDARSADQVIVDSVEHTSWFYTATEATKAGMKK